MSWEIEDVKADMLRIGDAGRDGSHGSLPAREVRFIAVTGRGMRGRGWQKCPDHTNATRKRPRAQTERWEGGLQTHVHWEMRLKV